MQIPKNFTALKFTKNDMERKLNSSMINPLEVQIIGGSIDTDSNNL